MATTTIASSGADLRVSPKILAAMRRRYREHPPETHPGRREHLALKVIAETDPNDRLGLSGPADTDRLNHVINEITTPHRR